MDTLDFNDPYYDRKSLDLQRRYDEQYELIEDMESQLAEIQGQIDDIHQEKITADNIYHLLLAFDEVYNAATEVEQKEFMRAFIERIDIFPKNSRMATGFGTLYSPSLFPTMERDSRISLGIAINR